MGPGLRRNRGLAKAFDAALSKGYSLWLQFYLELRVARPLMKHQGQAVSTLPYLCQVAISLSKRLYCADALSVPSYPFHLKRCEMSLSNLSSNIGHLEPPLQRCYD